MGFTSKLFANPDFGWSNKVRLPEHRQIELYTKPRILTFDEPPLPEEAPLERIAALARAAVVFEATLAGLYPTELPLTSWARAKDLPKTTMVEKVALQLHRVTRILRLIAFHPHGQVEMRNGVICMGGVIGKEVYYFDITAAGLDLIETMVAYWFSARDSVYPESYVGWVFSEMFFDLGGDIRRYSDEGRTLYQFQRKGPFNRHFRFDCDNPKTTFEGDFVQIDIPAPYRDSARYAIDFFAVLHDVLHIIPVEALKDGKIAVADLPKWEARAKKDPMSLPAAFRKKFGRLKPSINQPMT
ncbi:hypothetical protein GJ654_08685 [Rhodoblastus acidophilus]|uniref:Uncharacterized protein n=1 Tax=Rhodoblastus acidophilus TaxID=1074 RepID=A0A6N8DKU1_RHOAC|nr:hypothetical protein [Rhodoblastus acidophilus]MCW2273781.1 hypothetical protein [Rhodoblastus acidophilus]MTV31069.1 hypothetical protein [Rhodoblastus acidophilus]